MRKVAVGAETNHPVYTGGKTIGTTPVAVSTLKASLRFGVTLRTDSKRRIWVGVHSGITPGTSDQHDGLLLTSGHEVYIPARTMADVFAVSDRNDQRISFLAY